MSVPAWDNRSLADEWFDDFICRVSRRGGHRRSLPNELRPRGSDLKLQAEKLYDADTARCLAIIRAAERRRTRREQDQWETINKQFMSRIGIAA